jgi:hypothetical protein
MIRTYWGQKVLDMGDRWRTNIFKLHLSREKIPQFSLNGKLLRAAIRDNVPTIEVAFPNRYSVVVSKTPREWLQGVRVDKQYNYDTPMDFYYWNVPNVFPREGKKKDLLQAPGQLVLA